MVDARFEDGGEQPLRLRAEAAEDLPIVSALVQDAVFTGADMGFSRKSRRFDVLLNRFRWEDRTAAERARRPFERVRSVLSVMDVISVASQGLGKDDKAAILSVLALEFEPGEDGMGTLMLVLAGDGAVRLTVECVNLTLTDVTRPYRAPSGKVPQHPEG
ncbi:MAG: DUF2948 family protein [Rhodobacterales bacterium]|nr:DUF2948 family protein [Rhodobacterales bacterium]MDX5498607.1 DUF2948 family protein [Rhodobacterales bacterium]